MVRAPCCEKMGLKKGPWTPDEDQILISFIQKNGHGNWRALPKQAGLLRCGKSCRLRWTNYLRPDIKRGNFSKEEEDTIINLHEMLGNRWSAIAARLPGRTDNEIKNVWHTHLKKKLKDYRPPNTIKRHSSSSLAINHNNTISSGSESENSNVTNIVTSSVCNLSSQWRIGHEQKNSNVSNTQQIVIDPTSDLSSSNWQKIRHEPENLNVIKVQQVVTSHTRAMSSPQRSSSDTSSMTVDSSITMGVDPTAMDDPTLKIKQEGVVDSSSSPEYFPQIDESFWTEDVTNFPWVAADNEELVQIDASVANRTEDADMTCHSKVDDDMDFWYNVFIRSGDLPELPEF